MRVMRANLDGSQVESRLCRANIDIPNGENPVNRSIGQEWPAGFAAAIQGSS
jgi:hypothetical protein